MTGMGPQIAGISPAPGRAATLIAFRCERYEIWIDALTGIVHVTQNGVWTLADADAYTAHMAEVYAVSRARRPHILMLADMRGLPRQNPEVGERIGERGAPLYREGDRVAVLVDSSLMKAELRRSLPGEQFQSFVSIDAAMTWMLACSSLRPS